MQHITPQNVSLFYKAFKVCIVQVLIKRFKGLIVSLTMLQFHIILLLLLDFCICNFTYMQFTFQTLRHSFFRLSMLQNWGTSLFFCSLLSFVKH